MSEIAQVRFVSSWSLSNKEFRKRPICSLELISLNALATQIGKSVEETLHPHEIWVWTEKGPLPPQTLTEHVRVSFHPALWKQQNLIGYSAFSVTTTVADGEAINADICDAIDNRIPQRFVVDDMKLSFSKFRREGPNKLPNSWHGTLMVHWEITGFREVEK